ncbi:DUF4232 domain-containing protein [Streptomyces sp. NPDC058751]|uniref:DUF4232 domain-containing protein n=1 Tax=Streptomyces sp. NPDC058751 TaxID=3346623 RepID=UPI0036A446E0
MIATNRHPAGAPAPAGVPARSEVPTVSSPARGAPSRTAVPRGRWARPVLLVCLLAAAATGCGLSAEIDRELDPGRTSVPDPGPSVIGTDAAHLPDPSGTYGGGPLVIEVPERPGAEPSRTAPALQGRGCPSSGLRLDVGPGDAAMGLRGTTLTLTVCGERPYEVNGHPSVLRVLDRDGAPITGVRAVEGTDEVFMAPADPGPEPFTLQPGESARACLYWRMAAQEGVYLRIAPQRGQRTVTLRLPEPLDIGPENVLGTTAWVPVS